MLSTRVRDQLRVTGRLLRMPSLSERLQEASGALKACFAISLACYLLLKLVGVFVELSPLFDLSILPAGVCALGVAAGARSSARDESEVAERASIRGGLAGAALLAVFTITYLSVNTIPIMTSQDESAIVNGGRDLATNGSLRVTSPLNDQYHTNIIGALHVTYRTPTEMYYRTFPGTAALYAPFSIMPDGTGYRLFTAAFGTLAIVALYIVARKLLGSWPAAVLSALTFAVSPAFGHWAVTVYDNMPVLALELSAFAVALWAPRERTWAFGLAGALLSVAFFARVTEVIYVLPLVALVCWRTRSWRPIAAFTAAGAAGVALIAATNLIFFHDALFLPHVGDQYLYLPAGASPTSVQPPPSAQTLLGRYGDFSSGALGSATNANITDQIKHVWFHVRYMASSTFAFPFLALALLGLAWRIASGRRNRWLLPSAALTVAVAVLAIYGRKVDDYYGYGETVVRSSFVRYSLPVYAMLGIGAGAFALEAQRLVRGVAMARALSLALLGVIMVAGVAKSYDAGVYGFNRLNEYRKADQAAWREIKPVLDQQGVKPLVIGGPSVEKLVDSDYEHFFVNYTTVPVFARMPIILDAAKHAAADRPVMLVLSQVNSEDKQLQTLLYTQYQVRQVAQAGDFSVEAISFLPAHYTLGFVDVWNTYNALTRWAITQDGYLQSIARNSYVQIPDADINRDGRMDHDTTIQLEVQDSGPSDGSISGVDSRTNGPVPLWQMHLAQTGQWLTVSITLHKGDTLGDNLIVSKGLTLRSSAIVAVGAP